mmetsp:Transcript_40486/g.78798  ORF Transcript_40486/g.78798 Transcript_40486/m.78798 type:complete len:1232 (+) Transcript_40486:142-3837(+)
MADKKSSDEFANGPDFGDAGDLSFDAFGSNGDTSKQSNGTPTIRVEKPDGPSSADKDKRDASLSAALIASKRDAQKFKVEAEKQKNDAKHLREQLQAVEAKLATAEKERRELAEAKGLAVTEAKELRAMVDRAKAEASTQDKGREEVKAEVEKQLGELSAKALKFEQERDVAQARAREMEEELKVITEKEAKLVKDVATANEDALAMEKLKDKQIDRLKSMIKDKDDSHERDLAAMKAAAGGGVGAGVDEELEKKCKALQERVTALEAENVDADSKLKGAIAEQKKLAAAEYEKLRTKFSTMWKAQEKKYNEMKQNLSQTKSQRDAATQKLKLAATAHANAKKIFAQQKSTIAALEKQVSDANAKVAKADAQTKKDTEALEKEKAEMKEKLDAADDLKKQVEDLNAERINWFDKASNLTAEIKCSNPLQTSSTATVSLKDTPDADYAVQWFRSSPDGAFRVIQNATRKTHYCTVDDMGCVLKASCTILETGITASAFTPQVRPNKSLLQFVRIALQKDQATLDLAPSADKKAPQKRILLNGRKMKIRWGRETKNKAEFNQDFKIKLDEKTPNKFALRLDKKELWINFAAKSPFDRDTIALTLRAFNSLHLYKDRQAKLRKHDRDLFTAPLEAVLMSACAQAAEGTTEDKYRMQASMRRMSHAAHASRTSRSSSRRQLSAVITPAAKNDDSASQAEGGGDESKKGENDGEKSETNKEKSKKKGGIDLSKYGMKDKGENFWSSDEDEDEGKNKFKFKIKSEAEAAKEKEEKARSRTASSVSLGAPPLAAPQQTPSRRRGPNGSRPSSRPQSPRRRKKKGSSRASPRNSGGHFNHDSLERQNSFSSNERSVRALGAISPPSNMSRQLSGPPSARSRSKKKGGRKKGKKGLKAAVTGDGAKGHSKAPSMASVASHASQATDKSHGTNSAMGSVLEEVKEEGKVVTMTPEPATPEPKRVEPKEEPKNAEPRKPVDPLDFFFSAPKAPQQTSEPVTATVNEALKYTVKNGKVVKMEAISGEVYVMRTSQATDSALRHSIKLQSQDGSEMKFDSFRTAFQEKGQGGVDVTIPFGQKQVTAVIFDAQMQTKRVPILGQMLWKFQEKNAFSLVQWLTNRETMKTKADTVFVLGLSGSVVRCSGKSGITNMATKQTEWNTHMATYDNNTKQLKWVEKLHGGQSGRQQAAVELKDPMQPCSVTATVTCTGNGVSLSGVRVVDMDGGKLNATYSYTVTCVIEP